MNSVPALGSGVDETGANWPEPNLAPTMGLEGDAAGCWPEPKLGAGPGCCAADRLRGEDRG